MNLHNFPAWVKLVLFFSLAFLCGFSMFWWTCPPTWPGLTRRMSLLPQISWEIRRFRLNIDRAVWVPEPPFAVINNAMARESTRLNSYSYEIAFLKHAAVLAPLGGISIGLADARVTPLISVKTHNGEPFTSIFEKWRFYCFASGVSMDYTERPGCNYQPPSRFEADEQTRWNLSFFPPSMAKYVWKAEIQPVKAMWRLATHLLLSKSILLIKATN